MELARTTSATAPRPSGRCMVRVTWALGLSIGTAFAVFTPAFESPDEHCHFLRAYHCSEGKLYAQKREASTGDWLPGSVGETWRLRGCRPWSGRGFSAPLEPDRREFLAFPNTAVYSPIPYLPGSLVIAAGRLVPLPPMALFYAGRMANVLAYVALAAAALQRMPVQRWTLFLIAMMPLPVFLAGTLSADVVTNGVALLVIAMVLHYALRAERLTSRDLAALLFWFVVLNLSKQGYGLLPLLSGFIPAEKMGGRWRHLLLTSCLVGIPILLSLAWSLSMRSLYTAIPQGVNPSAQFHYVLTHPREYATLLLQEMARPGIYYYVVGVLGWYTVFLPQPVYLLYWLALGITALVDGDRAPFGLGLRITAAALFALQTAIIVTLMYMNWNPVGSSRFEGFHPRYLIPVLPLAFLPFQGLAATVLQRWSAGTHVLNRASSFWGPSLAVLTVIVGAAVSIYSLAAAYPRG